MAGLRLPLADAHTRDVTDRQRTVRGRSDWLSLLRRTLSFPIPSRFIPALSRCSMFRPAGRGLALPYPPISNLQSPISNLPPASPRCQPSYSCPAHGGQWGETSRRGRRDLRWEPWPGRATGPQQRRCPLRQDAAATAAWRPCQTPRPTRTISFVQPNSPHWLEKRGNQQDRLGSIPGRRAAAAARDTFKS